MRKILVTVATAVAVTSAVHCHSQLRPLELADSCACRPSEYCKVAAERVECLPLPDSCGAQPSCNCVGDRTDACRDEDGRITLLPPRPARTCEACSPEEYCIDDGRASCRVLPPGCDEKASCDCVLHTPSLAERYGCEQRSGRVVVTKRREAVLYGRGRQDRPSAE